MEGCQLDTPYYLLKFGANSPLRYFLIGSIVHFKMSPSRVVCDNFFYAAIADP